jgi:hypothetical protein
MGFLVTSACPLAMQNIAVLVPRNAVARAILAEDADKRSHWLEAAARWFSLGREEGASPQRQTSTCTHNTDSQILTWLRRPTDWE